MVNAWNVQLSKLIVLVFTFVKVWELFEFNEVLLCYFIFELI